MKRQLFLILILFWTCFSAFSQSQLTRNFSVNDGLPSSTVYSTIEGSQDFLWFCTDAGVARYNGYEFQVFNTEHGLSGNEVFQMHEDSKHRIWFLTYNGTFSYFEKGQFFNASNSKLIASLKSFQQSASTFLSSFCEINETIYISYRNNQLVKIGSDDKVSVIDFEGTLYNLWEHENQLWMLGSKGVSRLKNGKFELVVPHNFGTHYARILDLEDQCIFGYKNQLFEFDYKSIRAVYDFSPNINITALRKNSGSQVVVCSNGGLSFMDENLDTIVKQDLDGVVVTDYFIDSEGNVWITTMNDGIISFVSESASVLNKNNGFLEKEVSSIFNDGNGEIWCGLKNYTIQTVDPKNTIRNIYFGKTNFNESIKNIRFGKGNELLFIGKDGVLIREKEKFTKLMVPANDGIYYNGYYYFAGSWFWRIKEEDLHVLSAEDGDNSQSITKINEAGIFQRRINSLALGPENTIYLGAQDGLYVFDVMEAKPQKVSLNELPDFCDVSVVRYDPLRNITILGTRQHGVYLFRKGKLIQHLSKSNGLSSATCTDLYLDGNKLWIGNLLGVSVLDMDQPKEAALNILYSKGLASTKVNQVIKRGNELILATEFGLVLINDPLSGSRKIVPPRMRLISTLINAKKVNQKVLSQGLTYDQNSIQFNFVGISFRDEGELTYKYRLLGKFSEWRSTPLRTIQFESLPPGTYTFELYVVNKRNGKSSIVRQKFTIEKPFWEQTWFRLLIFVFSVVIIIVVWKVRINRLRKKHQIENALIDFENKKLQAEIELNKVKSDLHRVQLNPHFIYNSINSIYPFLYDKSDPNQAATYLSNLSQLIRDILESSFESSWTLGEEIAFAERYIDIQNLKLSDKVSFKVNVQPSAKSYRVPSLITQTFIENVFVHGFSKEFEGMEIRMNAYVEQEFLVIEIRDNGSGEQNQTVIPKHISRSGEIVKQRIESAYVGVPLASDYFVHAPQPQGYFVQLKLPLYETNSSN